MAVLVSSGVVAFQQDAEPMPLAATEVVAQRGELGSRPVPRIELHTPAVSYEVVGETIAPPRVLPVKPVDTFVAIKPVISKIAPAELPAGVKLDRAGKPIMVKGQYWTGEVFDYRPIRKASTRTMKTTAYSPDEKSCGKWADGITASGKSVWVNGGKLVAADKTIPFGAILTIPGYNDGKPVQVWDRGGAIKGNRLDVLYPTHEIALQWGVQELPVVFWEFVQTD